MVSLKWAIVFAALFAVSLAGVVRRDADGDDDDEHPAERRSPAFMEGLDDATKDKFRAIFRDHSLKGDAKDAALLKLAESVLKPDKLAEFKTHQVEWKKKREQWKANYDTKYAKLSPKAKKAADELKGLWDSGLDRTARKAKREEILKALSDAERKEVQDLYPKHGGNRTRRGADDDDDDNDEPNAEKHHAPSFFTGLDDATKEKFRAIFRDHTLKGDAKDAAILKLAESTLKPDKLAEFKTHQAEWKKKREQWKAAYEAKYAKLSPNAKKAADQLKGLWGSGLDRAARKAKREEILKGLSDAERKEVQDLFPHRGNKPS